MVRASSFPGLVTTVSGGRPARGCAPQKGDGPLDGRTTCDGDNTSGSIIPITILHHNDWHGNLAKGAFVGYTQSATLIKQERTHNPSRTLLDKLAQAQVYLYQGNTKAANNALNAVINQVKAQSGKGITNYAADQLIGDAQYAITHPM